VNINAIDFAAIALIGLAIYLGWKSGFVVQALALAGFVGGIALMIVAAPFAADLAADLDPWMRTVVVIAALGGVVLLSQALGSAVGAAARRKIRPSTVLGGVDQGLGAAFGMARGLFMVWLIGGLLVLIPMATLSAEAKQSTILRALDAKLPSPIVLAGELGRALEAAGLPDVLVGAPPPIEAPADGPSMDEAEAIAGIARESTVRVESTACGRFMTGSGFAVTPDHIVTNAHVVAGSNQVWISFDGSLDRRNATVVEFDSALDVALLYVPGLEADPVELASGLPKRGEPAAALGFTGGGRQRLIPGVISRTLSALGRDIYGGSVVAREVIEMRLDVSPGDSGGPVLLENGVVGGVTFSESREHPEIGYALSPVEVRKAIRGALNSSAPVATGACTSEP
jgi:S1-C subfamily serine protease